MVTAPGLALHQRAFGQFQFQPLWREARVIQDLQHDCSQIAVMELMRGEIDRQGQRRQNCVAPSFTLPAGFPQHPFANQADLKPVSSATRISGWGVESDPVSGPASAPAPQPTMRPLDI